MEDNSKTIYKKRSKENYLNQKYDDFVVMKEFFNKYLSHDSKDELDTLFSSKNYIKIYNMFFLSNNQKELIEIYSFINKTIVNLINDKLKKSEENKLDIDNIMEVINYINKITKKIQKIKNILITCTSRFDSDLIKSMNDNLDISSVFTISKESLIKFIENSEKLFLNHLMNKEYEKHNLYLSIFQFINISKLVFNYKKIEEFNDKIYEIITKESKYNIIYDEMKTKLNEIVSDGNKINCDFINFYCNSIYEEIEKDYYIFLKMLGEKEAQKYKEKIIKIYIFDKLIKDIFKNEKLLKIIISEKNYEILKIIESKTRQSLQLTKQFINCLFDILLNEFLNKVTFPKQKNDIPKGIEYIKKLLLKIIEINSIFKEVFNENRKVQLKFHETILKLVSSKKIDALEYYLSVYVNENLYKEKNRNNYIINKAFIQLLSNTNNKETFFKYHTNFIIKRISNNLFNLEIESLFHNFLKKNIENRLMIKINRIFKDINDTKFINDNNSPNYFYLFSFDTLDTQYDLLQIIDLTKQNDEKLNPFKLHMDRYNEIYPKRRITLSQIFSTLEVLFLNKYNLILNYIQWYIMQIILQQKNDFCITYEKLTSLIPFKPENKVFLKVYINSLIEMKILIKQSKSLIENELDPNDILKINLNFESDKNNIICFTKPNNNIRVIIKNINKTELEQKENEEENYIKNYKVNAVKENAGRIIDCIIIQILKALPSGEKIIEKELIINLIKHKITEDLQLRKYNVIETLFIKQRIDNLVKREIIKSHIDNSTNVISYSYY